MKYKKYSYLLVLILMLTVGTKNVFAKEYDETKMCHYMSSDGNFKTRIEIHWNLGKYADSWSWWPPIHEAIWNSPSALVSDYTDISIDKAGEKNYLYHEGFVANWFPELQDHCIYNDSVCFGHRYDSWREANGYYNNFAEPECPKYVVYQQSGYHWIWVTDDYDKATKAEQEINKKYTGFYGSLTTSDKYFAEFLENGTIKFDTKGELTCVDYEEIFGDPKDDGKTYDPDGDGKSSIRYMIDTILTYVRIIVPILIILLGTIDFAKAALANKEDNMKKAQMDFIKRVIIGVAVFFVPVLVDTVMWLADIVWEGQYPQCPL